ncbi:hypothetical protein Tco_0987208 [Tanacetum coccineum]
MIRRLRDDGDDERRVWIARRQCDLSAAVAVYVKVSAIIVNVYEKGTVVCGIVENGRWSPHVTVHSDLSVGQSTNFATISNASAFPTLDANAGDDELVDLKEDRPKDDRVHGLSMPDTLNKVDNTIGPANAELKEDRLKDDRFHSLSMLGTLNKVDRCAQLITYVGLN